MRFFITYILILFNYILLSQSNSDSLIYILSTTNDVKILAKTCYEISYDFNKFEKDTILKYIDKGVSLAKKEGNDSLIAAFYHTKAWLYDYYEEWNKSKESYYSAAEYYEAINDTINIAKCYINTGATEYYYGNYAKALDDYNISLYNFLLSKQTENAAKCFNNIALVYKSQGNYTGAIKTYLKSLRLKEIINDRSGLAYTYQNIGVLFWEQENYDEALNNYHLASDIFMELNDTVSMGNIFVNIGLIYKQKKDTATANKYYNRAISLLEITNYKEGLASALLNKGVIIDESGDIKNSEVFFLKSLKLYEQIGFNTGIMVSKVSLSRIYSMRGEHNKSLKYASEAIKIANKCNSLKYLSDLYFILSKNYINMHQYKHAYDFLNKYHTIRDSIFTLEKNKQINEIKTKYETEKKEIRIDLLEKEAKISNLELYEKNKSLVTISIILILTLCFSVFLLKLFIQKRKAYITLVEHNIELAINDIEAEKKLKENNFRPIIDLTSKKKQADSQLNEKLKKELLEDIIILMEEEKFFLNSQFTISDFAKSLKTNRYYISQIINEHFKTNFNNFVNEYRVKEARKLLISDEYKNLSIEGIALTVGFHSRATFNSAFKKFAGVTPSFFLKNSIKIQ